MTELISKMVDDLTQCWNRRGSLQDYIILGYRYIALGLNFSDCDKVFCQWHSAIGDELSGFDEENSPNYYWHRQLFEEFVYGTCINLCLFNATNTKYFQRKIRLFYEIQNGWQARVLRDEYVRIVSTHFPLSSQHSDRLTIEYVLAQVNKFNYFKSNTSSEVKKYFEQQFLPFIEIVLGPLNFDPTDSSKMSKHFEELLCTASGISEHSSAVVIGVYDHYVNKYLAAGLSLESLTLAIENVVLSHYQNFPNFIKSEVSKYYFFTSICEYEWSATHLDVKLRLFDTTSFSKMLQLMAAFDEVHQLWNMESDNATYQNFAENQYAKGVTKSQLEFVLAEFMKKLEFPRYGIQAFDLATPNYYRDVYHPFVKNVCGIS